LAFALALIVETNDCRRMADEKLIISTAGSREEASRIARALVEEKLAACVNIVGPIQSTSRISGVAITRIRELHSYDLPEAIEMNIDGGSSDYLKWIRDTVKDA
jgi:periplasmic divalent cation tolerance protein